MHFYFIDLIAFEKVYPTDQSNILQSDRCEYLEYKCSFLKNSAK